MSAKKMGLGRGFESLIPTELLDESFDPTAQQDEQVSDLRHIKLTEIRADPNQPRRSFDDISLDELTASIKEHGILQPIVVTRDQTGYVIVAGERRFRAASRAGLSSVPALVRTLSDQHRLELSLIENLQRRDLNPIETATAYLKLRDQFNLTLDQIGQRVGGKSVAAVSNTLRLLRLPEPVRTALVAGELSEGQARPLINVDADIVVALIPRILSEGWSARAIEQHVAKLKRATISASQHATKTPAPDEHATYAEQLEKQLHTSVWVRSTIRGKGQIVIAFSNDKEFQRITKLLGD